MSDPISFPFTDTAPSLMGGGLVPLLPIALLTENQTLDVSGLLDTGASVNVLPYQLGLQLGLVWETQTTSIKLTGNLANLPARVVIVSAQVANFEPVRLAFAWTRSNETPLILG